MQVQPSKQHMLRAVYTFASRDGTSDIEDMDEAYSCRSSLALVRALGLDLETINILHRPLWAVQLHGSRDEKSLRAEATIVL
jgi:hypothetical protein